jgi:4-diphosphocytidyl-2-C-methyl-D-erythritol kinase
MKLSAPAKVNLSLRILGKRMDGFHEIETLMAPVSLEDEITIETSLGRAVRVTCDDPALPQDDSNLAGVAARQFSSHTGRQFAAEILIEKRIPHGAGLGGGSSDAAAVLVALDLIFETHLGWEGLEEIAGKIGSDVPFFIRRQPAWCSGRGERVKPALLAEPLTLLLLKPPFGIETSAVYRAWAGSRELPDVPYAPQRVGEIELVNDLERPVFEKYLLLPVLKQWLIAQPGARAALMSGSGSTVFAVCESSEVARDLEARAKAEFGPDWWSCVCETSA